LRVIARAARTEPMPPEPPRPAESGTRLLPPERFGAFDVVFPLVVAAAFACVALPGLSRPSGYVFDEVYHAGSVRSLVTGRGPFDMSHPPLARLLMAAGAAPAGREAARSADDRFLAGARLPGALCATLALVLVYALVRLLPAGRAAAALACLLVAADTMFLLLARTAMTNVYGTFFALGGAAALLSAVRRGGTRRFALAGLLFGAAAASRWTAVALELGFGGLAAARLAWEAAARRDAEPPAARLAAALRALRPLAWTAAIAALAYLAAYAPLVAATGRGPWYRAIADVSGPRGWAAVLAEQGWIARAHASGAAPNAAQSPWWSWPLMLHPAWFRFDTGPDGLLYALLAVGNPLLWWASVPALVATAAVAARRRRWELAYAALPPLALWLAWTLRRTAPGYIQYYFEPAVFSAPAVALMVTGGLRGGGGGRPSAAAGVFAAAALAWAVAYLPLATYRPLTADGYLSRLLLRDRWDYYTRLAEFRRAHGLEDDRVFERFLDDYAHGRVPIEGQERDAGSAP